MVWLGGGEGWGGARRATGELVGTKKGARALIPLPLRDDRQEGGREAWEKNGTAVGGGGRRGGEGKGMLALRGGTCCRRRRSKRRGNLGG